MNETAAAGDPEFMKQVRVDLIGGRLPGSGDLVRLTHLPTGLHVEDVTENRPDGRRLTQLQLRAELVTELGELLESVH